MVLKGFNGIFTAHLRDEREKVVEGVKEVVRISERTGVTTIIEDFRPIKKFETEFGEALKVIEKSDGPIYFEVSPYPASVRPIHGLLPDWARKTTRGEMLERLGSRRSADIIKKEWGRINPDRITVYGAPGRDYLVGKSLRDVSTALETDARSGLLHLMRETNLEATVVYEDVDGKGIKGLLKHDRAFISSLGNSVASSGFMRHEKSLNSFPRFLEEATGWKNFAIEEVIGLITAKPARFFNLYGRGVIEEGSVADMVILGKQDYKIKDVVVGGARPSSGDMRGVLLAHEK